MTKSIETEITAFIVNGASQGVESITPDDRLLEDGIIDSLSLLDLVDFIETTYGIEVDEFEVDVDTFGTVRSIASYVVEKRG